VQASYAQSFEREQGFTAQAWLDCLPGAVGERPWRLLAPGHAQVDLTGGVLQLRWQVLEPRRIALATLPRLGVRFDFDASISVADRHAFMKYFDLYTQRGGG
jgi:hypothetical protein